ncbi:unnamed protein product [Arctia plantaginis]|uniref:Uncharacterized protein n=1 Tax=Arctia plantaginis TaxID=874455 RepID=A0A8S0YRM9_ARCPL|nr:unnamed protein product [Arctia plantaginis]
MTNDMSGSETRESAAKSSWPRRDDVKFEFGFGVPLGAMSAHPAFHSSWDMVLYNPVDIPVIVASSTTGQTWILDPSVVKGHSTGQKKPALMFVMRHITKTTDQTKGREDDDENEF